MPKPVLIQPRKHLGFKKKIINLGMWTKCDHCKKHHELYLNYNFENNSSSWADMMEKKLKWNEKQNLDDKTRKQPTTSNFKRKRIHPATMVHYF